MAGKNAKSSKGNLTDSDLLKTIDQEDKYYAEEHLLTFTEQAWQYVDPAQYMYNWHLELICEYLMAVSTGQIKRLVINIPPRYAKSLLVSIMWPCWSWAAIDPSMKWVFASYAAILSSYMSMKRRDLIQSEWYQSFWGDRVSLKADYNRQADYLNNSGGMMFSTSTGGTLTGMGGNCLLGDTLVDTDSGKLFIQTLANIPQKPKVLAFNHETGLCEYRRVIAARRVKSDRILEIKTDSGNKIRATRDHRFYVAGCGYKRAKDLRRGENLLKAPRLEEVTISSIEEVSCGEVDVYDIQVEGCHNFFADEILVHNCLVIDDPTNPQEALSEAAREQVNDWFFNTFLSRLDDKINGSIVLIQQRLHQRDLTGYLTGLDNSELDGYLHEKNGWTLVRVPLVAEMDEEYLSPLDGRVIKTVHEGELLWSEREGPDQIEEKKRDIFSFEPQYQQRPSSKKGAIFNRDWFQYYEKMPIIPDTWIMSVDTTYKNSSGADNVCIGMWAWKTPNMYLDHVVCEKMSFTQCLNTIRELLALYPATSAKLIEETANGDAIIDTLHTSIGGFIPIRPGESKVARAQAVTPYFVSKNVHVKMAPWTHNYIIEMVNFDGSSSTKIKKDDQCFVAGTKIATVGGDKPIEQIRVGDRVIVPGGTARVKAACCTGEREVISRVGLTGTVDHPVFVFRKQFTPLNLITQAITQEVSVLCLKEQMIWEYRRLLYSMESNTDSWEREDIISASLLPLRGKSELKDFMWRFMNFILERKFRKAMWFITRTAIGSITVLRTLSAYHAMNMLNSFLSPPRCSSTSKISGQQQPIGTSHKKEENGIVSNERKLGQNVQKNLTNVLNAVKSLKHIGQVLSSARTNVVTDTGKGKATMILSGYASCVANRLRRLLIKTHREQGKLVAENVQQVSQQKVFNIEVEGQHVYYANGILVSNCDMTTQAIDYMVHAFGGVQHYDEDPKAIVRLISRGRR